MAELELLTAALADRYSISREIGRGGMATVYLARDIKHNRPVALKVLPAELGAVLGVERFLAEIQVTANLQHPNLLPLFDSGEAAGLLYYVMPFVEGESLRARLDREKQLPIDEAVRITVAVASALDYAHRHGVIHRDLKPENILLQDGQPLLADFGIALAVSKAGGARVTQTGLSLGTPQYMSPEQAAGDRVIDARSDLYSLASVAYEMIAGEPPHSGNTAQAIIAKLMTAEPQPLATLRSTAPVHVDAAIRHALAKLPADRFATVKEFADALEGKGPRIFLTGATAGTTAPSVRRRSRVGSLLLVLVGFALGGGLFAVRTLRAPSTAEIPTIRFPITLPASLTFGVSAATVFAVSPDGRTLAFVGASQDGTSQVYLRGIDEIRPRVVPGSDGAQEPFFSTDGKWLAYWATGRLWRLPSTGGQPTPVAETSTSSGIAWMANGDFVASINNTALQLIPASGGQARILAKADSAKGEYYFISPVALPDGRSVIYVKQGAGGATRNSMHVLDVATGASRSLNLPGSFPLGVVDGLLIYVGTANTVTAVAFDERNNRVTGQPVPLGIDVLVRGGGVAQAALSRSGTLVYGAGNSTSQLVRLDEKGTATPLIADPRGYRNPRYSPNGKKLVYSVNSGARTDLWVYDVGAATSTRLTTEGTTNERPEWSPDGARVLFRSDRGARSAIWWQSADLSGTAQALLASNSLDFFEGVISPDGKYLAYQVDNGGAQQSDVMYRSLQGDTTAKAIATSGFTEMQPRISTDGKWIAYVTDASGARQVVVRPFPGPGATVQVSTTGGSEPVWSRDGKRLFFRDGRSLQAVSFTGSPTFTVTGRAALFDDRYLTAASPHANYDVGPDGRFLMVRSAEAPQAIVAYNWIAEVKARLATRAK